MYSKRRIVVISNTIVYTMKRGCNGNGHLRIEFSPMIWSLDPEASRSPVLRRPVSQQTNQIGQGRDRVILQVTQRFGIAAQEPIHLRGPDRIGRQWRAATAPDPGHLEAKMFGAGDVESVGRNKQHLIVLQTERLLDQRIAIRVRFEFPRAVNAEGRVEKSIKTGILDQSRQHRRTAV